MIQTNLYYKTKADPETLKKHTYSFQKGKLEGRDKLGVWDEQIHTTIYKQLYIYIPVCVYIYIHIYIYIYS